MKKWLFMLLFAGLLFPTITAEAETGSSLENEEKAPPFHYPGLIRMWYQSPFRSLNPHVFTAVVFGSIAGGFYYYRLRRKSPQAQQKQQADQEEKLFQHLDLKRKVILEKIIELEKSYSNQEIGADEFNRKKEAFRQQLVQVKLSLRQFTD